MSYVVRKQYKGVYHVLDEDGERVSRVAKFMPGPMVSTTGIGLMPPAMAKAVAHAMTRLANDIEKGRA